MTELVRPWRGVSATDRQAQRRLRLIEACLDHVAEVGVAATTVSGVCTAAGLSKRYFYESFAGRESLLLAAMDDLIESVYRLMSAELEALRHAGPAAAQEIATVALGAVVRSLSDDQRKARLYREAPADPALNRARDDAVARFASLLLAQLPAPATEPSATAAMLMLVFGATDVIGRWLDGSVGLSASELIESLSRVSAAGLRAMARPPG